MDRKLAVRFYVTGHILTDMKLKKCLKKRLFLPRILLKSHLLLLRSPPSPRIAERKPWRRPADAPVLYNLRPISPCHLLRAPTQVQGVIFAALVFTRLTGGPIKS